MCTAMLSTPALLLALAKQLLNYIVVLRMSSYSRIAIGRTTTKDAVAPPIHRTIDMPIHWQSQPKLNHHNGGYPREWNKGTLAAISHLTTNRFLLRHVLPLLVVVAGTPWHFCMALSATCVHNIHMSGVIHMVSQFHWASIRAAWVHFCSFSLLVKSMRCYYPPNGVGMCCAAHYCQYLLVMQLHYRNLTSKSL